MNRNFKLKLTIISKNKVIYNIFNYINKRKKDIYNNGNIKFIHIPKSAGVSMNKYIYGKDIGHKTIIDYTTNKNTKILYILRDPIEKIISSLVFLTYDTDYDSDSQYANDLINLSYKDRIEYFKNIPYHSFELGKFIPKSLVSQSYYLDFGDLNKLNKKNILDYYNKYQIKSDEKKDFINFLNQNTVLLMKKFKKHIDDYNFFKKYSWQLSDKDFLEYIDILKSSSN